MEQQSSAITVNSTNGDIRADGEDARNDGALVNALTGMGIYGKDKTQHTRINYSSMLSHPELEALYTIGLPRRYVDAIADAVLKHRATISLGGDKSEKEVEQIKNFEAYLKDLKVYRKYAEAIRLQRLYGGGTIIILADDGIEDFSQPLQEDNIRSIRGLCALSRHEIFPLDLSVMDWENPELYRITTNKKLDPSQTAPVTNLEIHASRVIRFDGLYLPWNQRQQNNGWGQAPLQVVYDSWRTYESAIRGLESTINDGSVFWHKIPGMMNMVKAGNAAALMKRMEINNLARSVYGGMLLDKDEEIGFSERTLANMTAATAPFAEYMQATTGWPASILMGTSPGGLGKEGRFEERVWSSLVEDWQTVYCQEPLSDLFRILMLAKDGPMGGKEPDSWELAFPSVFTETETEKTVVRQQQAAVDQIYSTLGVLNPLEIRNNRFGSTEYSIETVLDENVSAQMEMQADATFENNMNQLTAQSMAAQGLGPDGAPIPDPNAPPPDEGAPAAASSGGSGSPGAAKAKAAKKTDSDEIIVKQIGDMTMVRRDDAPEGDLTALTLTGPYSDRRVTVYKSRIQTKADAKSVILEGPQVTGFASMRAARRGLAAFLPPQTVFTLSVSPEVD